MLKKQAGEEGYQVGPMDIICILKFPDGKFYVTFFEEKPLPGVIPGTVRIGMIRLASHMNLTGGFDTIDEAIIHLKFFRTKIKIQDANVVSDVAIPVEHSFNIWVLKNWTTGDLSLKEAIDQKFRLVSV